MSNDSPFQHFLVFKLLPTPPALVLTVPVCEVISRPVTFAVKYLEFAVCLTVHGYVFLTLGL